MTETNKNETNRSRTIILSLAAALVAVVLFLLMSGFLISNNEILKITQIVCCILALGVVGYLLFFFTRLTKGIELINKNAYLLSKGQLNISDIILSKAKGLETLCIAFNDMKTNLISFTELTKTNVVIISDAIDKVSKSIDNSYKANKQIAASMGNVAKEAQDQLNIVKDTLESILNMNDRVNSIGSHLSGIENLVAVVVDSTIAGNQGLDDYYQQMNVITDNLSNTSGFIEHLNDELKEIFQLGELIMNITNQLKLLAFNASIESAKAGEVGRGFSVVALEMNKLSGETKKSITKINTLLNDVSDSSKNVKDSIISCIENYNASKESFSSIKESFYTIKSNADILSAGTKKVYAEASVISSSTHEVSEKGQHLFNASNKISSEAQEVAAVTEEELAGAEIINDNISSLKNMLSGIERLVMRFRTAVVPVDKVSSKRLDIVFISPLDHPFWVGVRQGVLYARQELAEKNTHVEYIGFTQDTVEKSTIEKIVNAFTEYVNKGCDGIVVPGFTEEIVPLIDIAYKKNIPVMLFNCDTPVPSRKTAFFGPNVNEAGTLAADLMIKALNGKGNVAVFRGGDYGSVHFTRAEKIKQRLNSKRKINLLAEIDALDNFDDVYNAVKLYLGQNRDVDGIFVTGGGVDGAAKAIKELGLVGKTRIVGFDFDKALTGFINEDIIYACICQDPFGQGHDPIIYLYNYVVGNVKPESEIIWTRTDVVDKNNVNDII